MTWLNWSLKLHSSLRTIPHLILTHNTQDFDSINAYLICVMVHVQMWCVCSITCWLNLKIFFECFICFWMWFYTFMFLVFCSKFIFMFFFKNWFRGSFARSLRLRASRKTSLREIKYFSISYRESCYCLASISWLKPSREMIFRQKLEIFQFHAEAITTVSRLFSD